MGIITFNGISSENFGIVVEHPPSKKFAKRNYEHVHVPGRNGDIIFDDYSYDNIDISYDIAIADLEHENVMYDELADKLSSWLNSGFGYVKLYDSYDENHFRYALYEEETDFENVLQYAGRAKITFNCKPQRFRFDGDMAISKDGTDSLITNPTKHIAKPLIYIATVNLSSYVKLNTNTITFNNALSDVYIDCDLKNVYSDSSGIKKNINSNVSLSSDVFPYLETGSNNISFSGVTGLVITPRWWDL